MSIHHWIEEAVLSPIVLAQRRGPIDCGNAARRRDHLRLRQGGVAGGARRRHAATMLGLASSSRRFSARQRQAFGSLRPGSFRGELEAGTLRNHLPDSRKPNDAKLLCALHPADIAPDPELIRTGAARYRLQVPDSPADYLV